jgi:hypothetical protein
MADTKPVYKYTNGEWEKQHAYQYTNGQWVEISSNEVLPAPTPNLVYTLSSDGTYYIVGTGFTSINSINQDSSGGNAGSGLDNNWTGGDLVIPNTYNNKPVLAIAPKAFSDVTNIDSVYVYEGITTIGHSAFYASSNETRLKTIQLPNSVINFTPNTGRLLYGRAGLENAIIKCAGPNGNFRSTFYNCLALKTIDFSSFVDTNITNMAWMFGNCKNLVKLDIRKFDINNTVRTSSKTFQNVFNNVPNNCLIIVKDKQINSVKSFIQNRYPNLTNVKTVSEYEDSLV